MKKRNERSQVAVLADELFTEIETAQGYAFVSDGETFPTKAQFFARVRGRLEYQKAGVEIMRKFLRKHKQLPGS